MAEIQWIKLTTNMFDDEKIKIIESMPDGDSLLIIWIKLILQAGKTNDGGFLYVAQGIPFTEETLATVFHRPLNTVRLAIKTFKSLQMIDISHSNVIYLPNFMKHQNIDALEKIREQNKERQKIFREKQKLLGTSNVTDNVTVTPKITLDNGTDIDIEEDIDKDKEIRDNNISNHFNEIFEFWNLKEIRVHKSMTPQIITKIKYARKMYSDDEIKKAIDNYATIIHNPQDYFFTYKWSLDEFLKRGIDKFSDDAQPLTNFLKEKKDGRISANKTGNEGNAGQRPNGAFSDIEQ